MLEEDVIEVFLMHLCIPDDTIMEIDGLMVPDEYSFASLQVLMNNQSSHMSSMPICVSSISRSFSLHVSLKAKLVTIKRLVPECYECPEKFILLACGRYLDPDTTFEEHPYLTRTGLHVLPTPRG